MSIMKSCNKFAAFHVDFISGLFFVPLNLENQMCSYERTLNQSYFIEFIFETIQKFTLEIISTQ